MGFCASRSSLHTHVEHPYTPGAKLIARTLLLRTIAALNQPDSLPDNELAVILLNPHGEVDGLILDGQLQVHVPPHLGRALVRHVACGDRIRVRGVKPRGADMVSAVQLTARDGAELVDRGRNGSR